MYIDPLYHISYIYHINIYMYIHIVTASKTICEKYENSLKTAIKRKAMSLSFVLSGKMSHCQKAVRKCSLIIMILCS